MAKKFTVKLLSAVIIISALLLIFTGSIKVKGSIKETQYKVVVVKEGDTLWSITKKNCSNYRDIRKAIYDLKKFNNIVTANILPGQKIKIPTKLYKD